MVSMRRRAGKASMLAFSPAPQPAACMKPASSRPDPQAHARFAQSKPLLWLIAAGFFMQTLDSTIVNTAAPRIAEALGATPLGMRTALTSYVLTLAVCIPASAWLTDRFGTRRIYAASVLLFTLGSAACGMAQTLPQLIAARVLQGIGGALLMPIGRYVLIRLFGQRDFVAAMSLVSIPGLLGPMLGPVLGGWLSEYASWRLIFLINVPVGLVGLWLNARTMPDLVGTRRPFDAFGFALFAAASGLLMTASEYAADARLAAAAACAGAGLVLGTGFVLHARRCPHPVSDLALFRVRSFWIALLGSLFTRLGISGLPFLLALYLQMGCGYSPLQAGLMMASQALAMMAMKPLIDPILRRFGYRRTLYVNTVLAALSLAAFALPLAPSDWPGVVALMFVLGLVMSLQYTAMNTLAFVDLAPEQAGHASSMTSTAQYLSMSFGIALATLLMGALLPHAPSASAYLHAFHATVFALAASCMVGAAVFMRLRRDRPLRTRVDEPEAAI